MTEHLQAKSWRESLNLSVQDLADLTGYSPKSIYWFETGKTPPNRKARAEHDREIREWVWQRYRMACAGVAAQVKSKKEFKW